MDSSSTHSSVCTLIVSYNFEPWLEKCLSSLRSSSIPVSVVVVDNGSDDNTCSIIKERYSEVKLIENRENLGFGRANNIGMEHIVEQGFKYVFLLNQDAWIEYETIEKLLNASKNNREYAVLSPVHLNGEGRAADFGFYDYTGIKNRKDALNLPSEITQYSFINAAMWLIPVEVWKAVGGFAHIFSHYGEDRNWVQRAQKHGYKVGVVKSAFGYHDREARDVSLNKFFYSEYVYFLTEAVNPLHSYPKAVAYSLFAALKKAFVNLFSGKPRDSKEYFVISKRLISMSMAIYQTRKEQRERVK